MCAYLPGGSGSVYMWMQYLQNSEEGCTPPGAAVTGRL